MRKIYIFHQYGDESHFKALYDWAKEYEYEPMPQVILSWISIIRKAMKIYDESGIRFAISFVWKNIIDHFRIWFLKDEMIVVGIAPYNYLLNKYHILFERNITFYFTSHTKWDGTDCLKGTLLNRRLFEYYIRRSFKGAFCVSELTAKQMSNYLKDVQVVNHSINTSEYALYKDNSNLVRRFIFLGKYVQRKNINVILKWLKKNRNENIEFHFVGEGDETYNIDQSAQLDNRIHNQGYWDKNKIKNELGKYDFMVLPSKREPFGIVLIEALAAGVPCIVSNAEGPKEIIEDGKNGYIFDLNNSDDSFCLAMKSALELTPEEYMRMKINAINKGKMYDSSEIIKKWVEIFDKYKDE